MRKARQPQDAVSHRETEFQDGRTFAWLSRQPQDKMHEATFQQDCQHRGSFSGRQENARYPKIQIAFQESQLLLGFWHRVRFHPYSSSKYRRWARRSHWLSEFLLLAKPTEDQRRPSSHFDGLGESQYRYAFEFRENRPKAPEAPPQ